MGDRRGSNPRITEPQSIALPLGDDHQIYISLAKDFFLYRQKEIKNEEFDSFC